MGWYPGGGPRRPRRLNLSRARTAGTSCCRSAPRSYPRLSRPSRRPPRRRRRPRQLPITGLGIVAFGRAPRFRQALHLHAFPVDRLRHVPCSVDCATFGWARSLLPCFGRRPGCLVLRRLRTHIPHSSTRRNYVGQIVVVLLQVHEIGDIEESIALQADVDKRRLHAGQHAGNTALVDGSS